MVGDGLSRVTHQTATYDRHARLKFFLVWYMQYKVRHLQPNNLPLHSCSNTSPIFVCLFPETENAVYDLYSMGLEGVHIDDFPCPRCESYSLRLTKPSTTVSYSKENIFSASFNLGSLATIGNHPISRVAFHTLFLVGFVCFYLKVQ